MLVFLTRLNALLRALRDILSKRKRVRIAKAGADLWHMHDCVRYGHVYGVEKAYRADTPSRIPMYVLCGASGKPIPWRNKIPRSACTPVSRRRYVWERYLAPNDSAYRGVYK